MSRFTAQTVTAHLAGLRGALDSLEAVADVLEDWAEALWATFRADGSLLVAGNGGSAALASHLTGELVGRYRRERRPLRAIWLGADQPAWSAIVNDYSADEGFARQVDAFASPGDVVLLLSTSGRSRNLIIAGERAHQVGASVWAMTGQAPNPLAEIADRSLVLPGPTATVQEGQQVAVHLLCEALDDVIERSEAVCSRFEDRP
jgi:D-sedoheptulose 7-phosphate isomerase